MKVLPEVTQLLRAELWIPWSGQAQANRPCGSSTSLCILTSWHLSPWTTLVTLHSPFRPVSSGGPRAMSQLSLRPWCSEQFCVLGPSVWKECPCSRDAPPLFLRNCSDRAASAHIPDGNTQAQRCYGLVQAPRYRQGPGVGA